MKISRTVTELWSIQESLQAEPCHNNKRSKKAHQYTQSTTSKNAAFISSITLHRKMTNKHLKPLQIFFLMIGLP